MIKRLHTQYAILISLFLLTQQLIAQFPGSPVSFQREEVSEQKVQIALVLDGSQSMRRYLDQAKGELWYTVNEVLNAYEGYATPRLEIAILAYGVKSAGRRSDFVQILVPFTTDLDWAANELYSIQAKGHVERPIKAIETAIYSLNWSSQQRDLKFLFISGNETFTRSLRKFNKIATARQRNISINTIYGGSYEKGIKKLWKAAADYGQGQYFALRRAPRARWQHQPNYDRNYIARLNRRLYDTYLPYGNYGNNYWDRYCYLDDYAWDYGYDAYYWRVVYKTRVNYYNPQWDLVDAIACGYLTWDDIEPNQLPSEIASLDPSLRDRHVRDLWEQRQQILNEIRTYSAEQRPELTPDRRPLNSTGGGYATWTQVVDKSVRNQIQATSPILLRPKKQPTRQAVRESNNPIIGGKTSPVVPVTRDKAVDRTPTGIDQPKRNSPKIDSDKPRTVIAPEQRTPQRYNPNRPKNDRDPVRQDAEIQTKNNQLRQAEIIKDRTFDREVRNNQSRQKELTQEKADMQRMELEQAEKARQEQIAQDKAEKLRQEQIAKEQAEKQRIDRERMEKARQEQLTRDREAQVEREQAERQRVERQRIEREQMERERQAQIERENAERARQEQVERQRIERQRIEREQMERERQAQIERERAERAKQERMERERAERARQEQAERQRIERQRIEREQMERERQAQIERERAERAKQERMERERAERARQEQLERARQREQAERQQAARERAEKARQEQVRQQRQREQQAKQAREAASRRKQEVQRKAAPSPSKSSSKSSSKGGGGVIRKQ